MGNPHAAQGRHLIEAGPRGRLYVNLGAAPGAGKTYAMLAEGQRLCDGGVDVVVGLAETHGRADTEAMLAALERFPRREVSYACSRTAPSRTRTSGAPDA